VRSHEAAVHTEPRHSKNRQKNRKSCVRGQMKSLGRISENTKIKTIKTED
jgi:hypothetical protein